MAEIDTRPRSSQLGAPLNTSNRIPPEAMSVAGSGVSSNSALQSQGSAHVDISNLRPTQPELSSISLLDTRPQSGLQPSGREDFGTASSSLLLEANSLPASHDNRSSPLVSNPMVDVAAYAGVNSGGFGPTFSTQPPINGMRASASDGTINLQDLTKDDLAAVSRLEFPEVPAVLLEQAPEYEFSAHTRANVFLESSLDRFVANAVTSGYESGGAGLDRSTEEALWAQGVGGVPQLSSDYPLTAHQGASTSGYGPSVPDYPIYSDERHQPHHQHHLSTSTSGDLAAATHEARFQEAALAPASTYPDNSPYVSAGAPMPASYHLEGSSRHPYAEHPPQAKRRRPSPSSATPFSSSATLESPRFMPMGEPGSPARYPLGQQGLVTAHQQQQQQPQHSAAPPFNPLVYMNGSSRPAGDWSIPSQQLRARPPPSSREEMYPPLTATTQSSREPSSSSRAASSYPPGSGGGYSDWSPSAPSARPPPPLLPHQQPPSHYIRSNHGPPGPIAPHPGSSYYHPQPGAYGLGGGMVSKQPHGDRAESNPHMGHDFDDASFSRSYRRGSSDSLHGGNESDGESIDAPPPNQKAVALAQAAIKGGNGTAQQADMLAALNETMASSLDADGVARCPFPNCTKTFAKNRSYNLKTHLRSHSQLKPFACASCPRAFSRKHDLERHARVHSGDKPYICEVCGRGFPRSDALRRHWRVEKECGDKASEIEAGQPLPSVPPGNPSLIAPVKTVMPGMMSPHRFSGPTAWAQGEPQGYPPPSQPHHPMPAHAQQPLHGQQPPSAQLSRAGPNSMAPPPPYPSSSSGAPIMPAPPSHHLGVKRSREDW